jgi:hypothetical protein
LLAPGPPGLDGSLGGSADRATTLGRCPTHRWPSRCSTTGS